MNSISAGTATITAWPIMNSQSSTLAELAIESMFPADARTAELLAAAARGKKTA